MMRTFVRVELEHASNEKAFSKAMRANGFLQTVTGKLRRKELHLPGMYLLEGATPQRALELTREAAQKSGVRLRIFCLPVEGEIRFSNLSPSSVVATD